MAEHFDVVVIGAGISGETCARGLRHAGMRVALIERDRIGGETAYWASIPGAPLFGQADTLWRAQQETGTASSAIGWPRSLLSREAVQMYLKEAEQIGAMSQEGGTFFRAEARLEGPGRVDVGPQQLEATHIVIATGSAPRIPAIPGLAAVGFWTNREAMMAGAVPPRVVILGGDAQAIELEQMFRHFSTEVTLISRHDELVHHEDPEIGQLMTQHLHQQGVRVLLGRAVARAERADDDECAVTLEDDTYARGRQVVVAGACVPRTEGLGIERVGARLGPRGVVVDEYCRAAEGVWAIGDVTGVAPLSHLAQYQARIVADAILGHAHPADYVAAPRVLFTDPQIAATGLTRAQLRERDLDALTITVDLPEHSEHRGVPEAARHLPSGLLTLHADRAGGVLVGAWAVAPDAASWIQFAALAIRAAIPLAVVRDMLQQFPAFGDVYVSAFDRLMAI